MHTPPLGHLSSCPPPRAPLRRILLYDLSILSIDRVSRPFRESGKQPVVRKLKEKLLEKAMIGFNGDSTALLRRTSTVHTTTYYVEQLTYKLQLKF